MSWQKLLEPSIQAYIKENETADVRQLALKQSPEASWPYILILDQIKVRQKARIKAPDLYETDGFIFPFGENFEQASSLACAKYKASVVSGESFVDLTAGSGVDAYALCQGFKEADLVERDHQNAELLRHNFAILKEKRGLKCKLRIHESDACEYVNRMPKKDTIFIDPQRRETRRKGIFDFKTCSPDIISLLPLMFKKANKIMVKASPVLDLHQAVEDLGSVNQIHVVGWDGDCKEVLYILTPGHASDVTEVLAVEVNEVGVPITRFGYDMNQERVIVPTYSDPLKYIYEPGPAYQKAGGFASMAQAFSLHKLHKHTHLYTSNDIQSYFPGKYYEVLEIISAKSKNLKIQKAEISLRNYPGTVEDLRKKLKLKEGGNHRIFAATVASGEKKLIICKK